MTRRKSSPPGRVRENFDRRGPHKPERARILIVCEDSVTAPLYFKAFCHDKRLTSADVEVCGEECGSAPSSVYEFAKKKIDEVIAKGLDVYDRVYCVFDKDGHSDYESTLKTIRKNKKYQGKDIIAAQSIPCFEFWVLLHFEARDGEFRNCTKVCQRIKKEHIARYTHPMRDVYYPYLKDKTDVAIKNSKQVLCAVESVDRDNPSSHIHILIEDLIAQSKK